MKPMGIVNDAHDSGFAMVQISNVLIKVVFTYAERVVAVRVKSSSKIPFLV